MNALSTIYLHRSQPCIKGKLFYFIYFCVNLKKENSGIVDDGERIRESKGRKERAGTRVCKTRVPPQLCQNMELELLQ